MKKYMGMALMVLCLNQAASAARGAPNGQQAIERIQQELQLTDQQANQVRQIMDDEMGKIRSLRQSGADRENMRSQFQSLRNDLHERLSKVLNPEQMQKFDQLRAQMRERRRSYRDNYQNNAGTGPRQD